MQGFAKGELESQEDTFTALWCATVGATARDPNWFRTMLYVFSTVKTRATSKARSSTIRPTPHLQTGVECKVKLVNQQRYHNTLA
jgi:hypothetical protein